MNRARQEFNAEEIVLRHWGEAPPDWIKALGVALVFESQAQVGRKIGVSVSAISNVLRNRYGASTDNIEAKVRTYLMRDVVNCPELGDIERAECQDWQLKARNYVPTNRDRTVMAKACRKCPHNKLRKDSNV